MKSLRNNQHKRGKKLYLPDTISSNDEISRNKNVLFCDHDKIIYTCNLIVNLLIGDNKLDIFSKVMLKPVKICSTFFTQS